MLLKSAKFTTKGKSELSNKNFIVNASPTGSNKITVTIRNFGSSDKPSFDANVKIEPLTNLKFKSVILANKMFIFGFILSGIYIWCIYYLMKDSTLETNDNITVVNKKKKKFRRWVYRKY